MLCQVAAGKVTTFLNNFFTTFNYQHALPLPAPFNKMVLDYHITGFNVVKSDATYLEASATGEVFRADGGHDPNPHPVLPKLTAAQLAEMQVSAQVSEFTLNSLVWTLYTEGLLHYGPIAPSDLPSSLQSLLNTNTYKLLIPKLYFTHPNTNMSLFVNATAEPKVAIVNGKVAVSVPLDLVFSIPQPSPKPSILAFSLTCPFTTTANMQLVGNNITAKVDSVNATFQAGLDPFGGLGPKVIKYLDPLLNQVLNGIVLPLVNLMLQRGFPLPSIHASLPNIGQLDAVFVNPKLSLDPGFLIVGTNVSIKFTPAGL